MPYTLHAVQKPFLQSSKFIYEFPYNKFFKSKLYDINAICFFMYGKFHTLHSFFRAPTLYVDCDRQARILRAHEIEQGVDPPANSRRVRRVQVLCSDVEPDGTQGLRRLQLVCPLDLSVDNLRVWLQNLSVRSCPMDVYSRCHAQADFIHCLVPDLLDITNCSFYWGKWSVLLM